MRFQADDSFILHNAQLAKLSPGRSTGTLGAQELRPGMLSKSLVTWASKPRNAATHRLMTSLPPLPNTRGTSSLSLSCVTAASMRQRYLAASTVSR